MSTTTPPLDPHFVIAAAGRLFGMPAAALLAPKGGSERTVKARYLCAWLLRRGLDMSLKETAFAMQRTSLPSICRAVSLVDGWREQEPDLRGLTDQLLSAVKAKAAAPSL